MDKIYTIEYLIYLRESPLVSKPPGLPPSEQWMGLTADSSRNINKSTSSRTRPSESVPELDPITFLPAVIKHLPRTNANSEDNNLGPSKTSSISGTSIRNSNKTVNSPDRLGIQDTGFGTKTRVRINENDRGRESRSNLLRYRRTESDQENEGWNSIQPRKSFSGEDAEKFINRPGGDKSRDDKVFKDREDYEGKERSWGSNNFSREKDVDNDQYRERSHRNSGTGRGRNESSWFKEKDTHEFSMNPKSRHNNENYVDRNRGWRGREKDDRGDLKGERYTDKTREKQDSGDHRWDRIKDHRHENEPEWMEDPGEERYQAHTLADFEKWKEQMQGKDRISKSNVGEKNLNIDILLSSTKKPKMDTPLDFDPGPDKFLGSINSNEENTSDSVVEPISEGLSKSKTIGKASRFTSFFTTQDESQRNNQDNLSATHQSSPGPIKNSQKSNAQSEAEKEAFQQLLQKLQRQTLQASSVSLPNISSQQKSFLPEKPPSATISSQELYSNYTNEGQEEKRSNTRLSQQAFQELLSQRQIAGSQNTLRPEQMLQELISQRQNAMGQNSSRIDHQTSRNTNTEFLMGLMQSGKSMSDSQRSDTIHLGIPPKSENRQVSQHNIIDREQEIQRETLVQAERNIPERHTRPQPPPGFFEESSFTRGASSIHDRQSGNSQPTQMMQRPLPPGLEMGWERQTQLPPPQHRHVQNIVPPPGLAHNLNRGVPLPQQAFPPGFSIGNFPPPDVMTVSPRNIQMQPPPGFFSGPPHGFLTPAMNGFQGPDGMAFGAAPFDGRGPPSQGTFRR